MAYNYYNPYSYYSNDQTKSLRKLEKYVSFARNLLGDGFSKLKNYWKIFLRERMKILISLSLAMIIVSCGSVCSPTNGACTFGSR